MVAEVSLLVGIHVLFEFTNSLGIYDHRSKTSAPNKSLINNNQTHLFLPQRNFVMSVTGVPNLFGHKIYFYIFQYLKIYVALNSKHISITFIS